MNLQELEKVVQGKSTQLRIVEESELNLGKRDMQFSRC